MSGTFKIQEGHPIDENLRPIRIGDDLASLEISRFGSGAKVTGDLIVTGNIDTIRTTCIQSTGDISIEAGGNIALDTDGGYVNLLTADNRYFHFTPIGDGGVEFGVRALTSESDIFKINVGSQAGTTISTTDDGGTDGDITFQADGNVAFNTIANKNIQFIVGTKTQSDAADYALSMTETLDLSSGASGSDNHYGLRYKQTQTNIAGWDNVYLMYLDGGSGKILSVDGSGQIQLSNDRKIMFGDAGEYISGTGTDLTINSSRHITIDTDGSIYLDSATGVFIARKDGTEFSSANSSYAGMILGYTVIGDNATPATYDVLSSMNPVHDDLKVSFVFPPSGKVEIMASIYVQTDTGRAVTFGLSTTDASTGFTSLGAQYENHTFIADETDGYQHTHRWYITGTAGASEELWFAAGATQTGRIDLFWGGDSSSVSDSFHPMEYQPFIMKATALPTGVYEG